MVHSFYSIGPVNTMPEKFENVFRSHKNEKPMFQIPLILRAFMKSSECFWLSVDDGTLIGMICRNKAVSKFLWSSVDAALIYLLRALDNYNL